jgi:hypothetical protein
MVKFCNKCTVVPAHDKNAYRSRHITVLTLNMGIKCKWLLNFMPWLLLHLVKDPLIPTA